ncbi:MAG: hypothetical protein K0S12_1561, partial [Bacteroidetes bacterium]|nr:hypothetical protein [Bacteroidota bacterium]
MKKAAHLGSFFAVKANLFSLVNVILLAYDMILDSLTDKFFQNKRQVFL